MYEKLSMANLLADFPHFSAAQWLTVINLLYYYFLLSMAAACLYLVRLKDYLLPASIIMIGTLMLLLVGHGEASFHQPFMPFFILMAALSINQLRTLYK